MENEKMKKDQYYHMIKGVLDKLEKEGVEAVYQSVKKWNYSNGSSRYSALINDLIGVCPEYKEWQYPRVREHFRQDVIYYCKYHMDYYED